MRPMTQTDEKVAQLRHEYGWTEEEARRFLQRAKRMLVDDIVGVPPFTAAERRELGLDLKFGDEIDEDDVALPPADHHA